MPIGLRIKVNAACPGFTATALNNFHGTRSIEEAACEPVRLALLEAMTVRQEHSETRTARSLGDVEALLLWEVDM